VMAYNIGPSRLDRALSKGHVPADARRYWSRVVAAKILLEYQADERLALRTAEN